MVCTGVASPSHGGRAGRGINQRVEAPKLPRTYEAPTVSIDVEGGRYTTVLVDLERQEGL